MTSLKNTNTEEKESVQEIDRDIYEFGDLDSESDEGNLFVSEPDKKLSKITLS